MTELGKFVLNAFGLSITGEGVIGAWLAVVPVTIFLIAIAYRLVRPAQGRSRMSVERHDHEGR
jgi:uncharacterized membrane protein YbaN (DUF454 family)